MATEAAERPPSPNGLKRRQSGGYEQENKRRCVSPGKSNPEIKKEGDLAARESSNAGSSAASDQKGTEPKHARRKSNVADEKKRSKRLFGALLGNLNQPSDRESKRRREIEDRRKAELQRQDNERLENKKRRLDRLAEQRRDAQRKFDEQNMRMRHTQLLDAANFLQTTTEPKLFYRPWDLRTDEDDRLDEQIREAEGQIERELCEFEGRPFRSKAVENPQQHDRRKDVKPLEEGSQQTAAPPEDQAQSNADPEEPQPALEAPAESGDTDKPKDVHEAPESSDYANTASTEHGEPAAEEEQAVRVDKHKDGDHNERSEFVVEDANGTVS
ncbi:hypothetical protein EJ03DRAFT_328509 [Teratosphaeria nubilosa]|uniref:Pinin/SDK/MemA protein domain-containing protein n=1 Tax=Teratosphaeria nubilosa TaxID=161662 RepID=A0A6G1L5L4_9PEZI|nr:hypothetical protein EJ03DRAFT_328509 [Teratosphaeria nubilosa]